MSVGLCVKVNGGLMFLDVPQDQAAGYVQAGAYYYNGDSRLDQAGKTNWCNVRHPNEAAQAQITQLPKVGASDWLPVLVGLIVGFAMGVYQDRKK